MKIDEVNHDQAASQPLSCTFLVSTVEIGFEHSRSVSGEGVDPLPNKKENLGKCLKRGTNFAFGCSVLP